MIFFSVVNFMVNSAYFSVNFSKYFLEALDEGKIDNVLTSVTEFPGFSAQVNGNKFLALEQDL